VRVRPLLHNVLSTLRRPAAGYRAHVFAATAAVVTAAAVTPVLVGAADASAELSSQPLVHVTLAAPASVTRGAGASLLATAKTAVDAAVPAATVQFVSRAPGASTWQVIGSATTGADGTATLPVRAVGAVTEFGAYLTVADTVVKSDTATAVVHVIDIAPSVPTLVRYNARVTLAGHLLQDGSQALASQRVSVRFRPRPGAAWTRSHWVTTNAAGVARVAGRFTHTFQVGIQFPGAGALAPSPLAVKTVRVVPRPMTARNGFRFPFLNAGMVTSPGSWSLDQGVDIFAAGEACGAAAKLVAVGDGTVIQTGISGFGPTAPVIRMSSGPFTGRNVYYGHTGRIYVHVGQHVRAGQLVAQIGCGSVGYSSAPHLEIGVGEPGGPPCCPAFGATARAMYRQMVAALYRR
jgi:murein DD-endopeptidase MepM/ murein hydrolase activator NlpD